MRAIQQVPNPFEGPDSKQTVSIGFALKMSATYLAQARFIYANLPDPLLWPDTVAVKSAKGQLAAQIGQGYAALADVLGKDL